MKKLSVLIFTLLAVALAGCGSSSTAPAPSYTLTLTSSAITEGAAITDTYAGLDAPTCTGDNNSPPLAIAWTGTMPSTVESLVIMVYDPDSDPTNYVHWIVYNIATSVTSIAQATAEADIAASTGTHALFAINSDGDAAYFGPCPPAGNHEYVFKVYAISEADLTDVAGVTITDPDTIFAALQTAGTSVVASDSFSAYYPAIP